MPLPLCKYLLTSLKFSCICGKILLCVCVCVCVCVFRLHPLVMLSQPVRALMNTFGPVTVFMVKGSWVWAWVCIWHGSVCLLVAYPLGSARWWFSLALMALLFRRVLQRFGAVIIPGLLWLSCSTGWALGLRPQVTSMPTCGQVQLQGATLEPSWELAEAVAGL